MMPPVTLRRHTTLCVLATLVCLMGSGALLYDQARTIGFLRHDAVPLAEKVGQMEGRLQLLSRQVEQAEASTADQDVSPQETVRAFLIPRGAPEVRAVSLLDHLGTALRAQGQLTSLSAITVTTPSAADLPQGIQARDVHLTAVLHADGWQTLSRILRLSGHVTVRDALTQDDTSRLLAVSEQASPAAAATLTAVFSMNLLAYAADPAAVEDRLLAALGSDAAGIISAALASPLLQDARALATSPVRAALEQQNLWPLPLVTLRGVQLSDAGGGYVSLALQLRAYGRDAVAP